MCRNYDFLFKLVLIGDSNAGKTDVLSRYSDDVFNSQFISRIGIDFKTKIIELGGKRVKLQIWDTAGQERFHCVSTSYYRGAMGIILIYNITNKKSFDNITNWLMDIEKHASPDVAYILVGNNCDMESRRVVPKEMGEQLATQQGIPFLEISAKANINIDKTFKTLARLILKVECAKEEKRKLNESLYDSAQKGSVKGVKEALSLGADINHTDINGETPLYVASQEGHTEVVIVLFKHRADHSISNKNGVTPLHVARNKDIAKYLISNGANVNVLSKDGNTVLHTVCEQSYCNTAVIDYLILKDLSVESRNKYGETPLHLAHNERIAKHLVDQYGADINVLTDDGNTILHTASKYGHEDILDYLIRTKGFKLNTLNKFDQTPIDILKLPSDDERVSSGRRECLRLLQQKGYYKESNDVELFKNAVARKGSVTYLMVQCMPFGPPRVGKTCLYNLLINKPSPGVRTTKKKLGSGSLSTDALTGRTIINASVGYRDTAKAITATGSTWSEVPTLDEEIALMVNTTKQQLGDGSEWTSETLLRHDFVSSISKEEHSSIIADQPLQEKQLPNSSNGNSVCDTQQNDDNLESVQLVKSSEKKADAVAEEAILKTITGPITYGRVNADKIQGLLKDSLTIFYTDTGGQPEFQEVLPALVAGPTIFLLTFSLFTPKEVKRFILPNKLIPSDPLNASYQVRYHSSEDHFVDYESSFTVKDVLLQCLSSIACFKDGQVNQLALNKPNTAATPTQVQSAPPISVLIIGTHRDLVQQEDVDKVDQLLREALANVDLMDKGLIEEYESQKQLVIPINNHDSSDTQKVRQVLERIIKRADKNGESPYKIELPLHWLGLELYLRKSDRSTMKYSECKAIARDLDIPVDELGNCLKYLHYKTGTIRYYDGVEELKDIVIIKPSVVFSAITKLITSTFVPENVQGHMQRYFTQYGLFKQSEIQHIFTAHQQSLQLTLDQFLALLRHLNILSRAYQISFESSKGEEQFDYFLPCALTHAPEANVESTDSAAVSSNPLLVSFKSGFMPKGVFSGLLAYFTGQLQWEIVCSEDCHPLLYRNQATLNINQEMCSVTMRAKATFLEFSLELYKKSTTATDSMPAFYNVQEKIKEALTIECNTLKYGQNWKLGVYCSECQTTASEHVAVVDAVRKTGYCPVVRKPFYLTDNQCSWFTPPTTHQGNTSPSSTQQPSTTDDASVTHKKDDYYLETKLQKTVLNCSNIFDLLRDKSAWWDNIGRELGVGLNDRESLRKNVSLDDSGCLERVIDIWLESSIPSWDRFITAVRNLQYTNDVITSLEEQQ